MRIVTKEVPQTFEDLSLKILGSITYRNGIKTAERNKRRTNSKIKIKSVKSRIPQDFNSFLLNGDKKTQLINIVFDYIVQNKIKCLQQLEACMIILSRDGESQEISFISTKISECLSSNQEEADTKVILHTLQALNESLVSKVHLRSPSADTDILVIALNLIPHIQLDRVFYEYGVGKHRNCLLLSDFHLPDGERRALIGFHAATGNDYTSAFFRKRKDKVLEGHEKQREVCNCFPAIG